MINLEKWVGLLMTNRDILNRELINQLFVKLFNQILDIEAKYMVGHGIADLSLSELHIIEAVSSLAMPTMSTIASQATLTNGTITTAIKKLELKGYVKRYKDKNDRRINRVELTAKGNRVSNVHREFHEEMVSRVCEDSHVLDDELLIKSLQQLLYFFEDIKERY